MHVCMYVYINQSIYLQTTCRTLSAHINEMLNYTYAP